MEAETFILALCARSFQGRLGFHCLLVYWHSAEVELFSSSHAGRASGTRPVPSPSALRSPQSPVPLERTRFPGGVLAPPLRPAIQNILLCMLCLPARARNCRVLRTREKIC